MHHQQTQWDTDGPAVEPEVQRDTDRESLGRALRELQAAEQRVERNAQRVYDETRSRIVMDLLPLLDNLDRTIAAATSDPALLEGVRMLRAQFADVLGKYGVVRLDAAGARFDPSTMEAVAMRHVDDQRYAGVVIEQITPGYRYGDRLLRPARVTVGQITRR